MNQISTDIRPAVLMDLDNTILDFNMAERTALSRTFTELEVPYDEELLKRYNRINIQHWEMLENGVLTREQVLVQRFEALYAERGIRADAWKTQDRYETLLSEGHWFMPGALDLLHDLQGEYRLFLCSNGSKTVQDGRIRSAGIADFFEKIFISEDMGCNKPEKRYFDICFEEIPGFSRERAIILGDSLSSDIRGGYNAGILSCWYNPEHRTNDSPVKPDYEIDDLGAFRPLLKSVFPD